MADVASRAFWYDDIKKKLPLTPHLHIILSSLTTIT